jgi:hypothetical protein
MVVYADYGLLGLLLMKFRQVFGRNWKEAVSKTKERRK